MRDSLQGFFKLGFLVNDADGQAAELKRAGVKFVMAPSNDRALA